jgi:hypothetical protein
MSSSATEAVTWQTAVDYFLLFPTEVLCRFAKLYYTGKDKHIFAEIEGNIPMMAEYMGDNVWGTGLDAAFKACSPEVRREMLKVLDIERTMNTVGLLREAAIEYGIDMLLQVQSIQTRVHFYQALGLSITKDGRAGMHVAILERGLLAFFSMRSFTSKILEELMSLLHLPIPRDSKRPDLIHFLVHYRPPAEQEKHLTAKADHLDHLRGYLAQTLEPKNDGEEKKIMRSLVEEENRIDFDDDAFEPEMIVIDMDDGLEDTSLFESTDVTEREIWREFLMEHYTGTVNVPMVAIFKDIKAFMRQHPNPVWEHLLGDGDAFVQWYGREIKPLLLEMKVERGTSPKVGMLCTFPSTSAAGFSHYFCCPQCRKGFRYQHMLLKHVESHHRRREVL